MSLTTRIFSPFVLIVVSTLLALLAGEFILRARGHRPWRPQRIALVVEPGGKMYETHPTLGYIHIPGEFKVVLSPSYSFTVTHLDNGLRATHPLSTKHAEDSKDEIWIFGCSLTYGWALNDAESYPWLLQKNLPDYEVVNFGVNGFGTVHSFIQFQEALESRKEPILVIINYAWFHDQRNAYDRDRKKGHAHTTRHPMVQPFARLNDNGELEYSMSTDEFYEFPLMRQSALMHFLEKAYNRRDTRLARSHEVSYALIKEFSDLCKENGIELVVAGLFQHKLTSDMLQYANGEGITTTDISVDTKKRGYNNLPHDPHPSALANKIYARKLEAFLMSAFKRFSRPPNADSLKQNE